MNIPKNKIIVEIETRGRFREAVVTQQIEVDGSTYRGFGTFPLNPSDLVGRSGEDICREKVEKCIQGLFDSYNKFISNLSK